ncbi:hypothetical protein Vadar_007795 [Vaccinium darrowii]|uniref:Uncharacterized protein n=1 Tax=Vaccinium darrowii TaxID=229202 RepID=A0ACB7YCW0_9ERIC|nr:hypothetical protein Vadar_007795 [Vaccinium darrowii]
MDEIYAYLKHEKLPTDRKEAHKVRCKASYFYLDQSDKMYRRSFMGPDLKVVHDSQIESILRELHEGSSGCHSDGRSLAHRALTQGLELELRKFGFCSKPSQVFDEEHGVKCIGSA